MQTLAGALVGASSLRIVTKERRGPMQPDSDVGQRISGGGLAMGDRLPEGVPWVGLLKISKIVNVPRGGISESTANQRPAG